MRKDGFVAPSIRELIDEDAKKFGETTFIKFVRDGKVEERSYKRVRENSLAVCRYIRSLNPERMHIALISKSNYEYITCLTGVLVSGNVAIPLAPETSAKDAAALLERADVDMVLYEDEYAKNIDELKSLYPSLKYSVNLGDVEAFNEIYEKYNEDSQYAQLSDIEVDKDACATIIFTSGTTGVRKGVMLSMNALVGNATYEDKCVGMLNEGDVTLSILPMYHIFCFSTDYIRNLITGITLCLNGNMRDLGKNLQIFKPRSMRVVPMVVQTLLQKIRFYASNHPELSPEDAAQVILGGNLKWLICGGAYLNPELIDAFEQYGIILRTGYGMSEAGCRVTVPDNFVTKTSVGRVINLADVRIQNGEVQIDTATVMNGYYKMPKETAEAFTEDGWLRTGDIGYLADGNQLYITGRLKNLIILSNGENVSPEAIEKKFNDIPLVSEVLVYAENNHITADVYPDYEYAEQNGIPDIEAQINKLVDKMNAGAKPSHIISDVKILTEPLEKTDSGKIKRKKTEF